MNAEKYDNLMYRYTFSCLSDLIDHIKDIQADLECLCLDLEELSDGVPDEELKARLEERLERLRSRR